MSDAGKCLDVMDDLSFWLDETEIIITTAPNYTDEQSLRDALEKVKVSILIVGLEPSAVREKYLDRNQHETKNG